MEEGSKFREVDIGERVESFSFSCREFNNSADTFFTDGRRSSSDESYIEIALEPAVTREFNDRRNINPETEMELRISFSSSIQLPKSVTKGLSIPDGLERNSVGSRTVTLSSSSSTSTSKSAFSRSSTEAKFWSAPLATTPSKFHKTLKRKLQFPKFSRLLDTFMPNRRTSSEEVPGKSGDSSSNVFIEETQKNKGKLEQGREMPNIKKRGNKGTVMKFFMKMKSKKIGAILTSLMKPHQFSSSDGFIFVGNKKKRSEEMLQKNSSQVTPWERSLVYMQQGKNKGIDMKFDAIRQVVEAVGTGFGRNDRRRTARSCPSSRKSSPIHHGFSESRIMCASDSSIQAAIAHCKSSFGQSSEFQF